MAISKQAVRTYTGDYATIFAAVSTAVQAEGMRILVADAARGVVDASVPLSWASWGENVHISVGVDQAGGVVVSMSSGLKAAIVDWGRNRRNIERVFERIDAVLATPVPGPPAAGAPPAGAWHPDPHARHQFRFWDGARWTDQVSDDGRVCTDPAGA